MAPSDAELIERWQAGDVTAFEDLVRRWQQPVARFLSSMVGRRGQLEDLCQEVFFRVYRAGAHYRPKAAFSTWLYRISVNVVRDRARRSRRDAVPIGDMEPIG